MCSTFSSPPVLRLFVPGLSQTWCASRISPRRQLSFTRPPSLPTSIRGRPESDLVCLDYTLYMTATSTTHNRPSRTCAFSLLPAYLYMTNYIYSRSTRIRLRLVSGSNFSSPPLLPPLLPRGRLLVLTTDPNQACYILDFLLATRSILYLNTTSYFCSRIVRVRLVADFLLCRHSISTLSLHD